MTPRIPTYSLSTLLRDDCTIVIPDLQRDYCWGSDNVSDGQPHEKVTGFITGLLHIYRTGRPVPLGLIYGYTFKHDPMRLHIVDGQQRFTTLYLLIGMLYRRCPSPQLRRMLISDAELHDDFEPRLIYQVRNEAQWFLSDLVTRFFLERDGRLSQLEGSPWYYASYDSDPSVRGFIGAIRCIDRVLEQAGAEPEGLDFADFAAFVTDRLTLMYHDLGSKTRAEDMFITVNTTAQPLSLAQNARIIISSLGDDAIDAWDEMETACWLRARNAGTSKQEDPMDGLLRLYARWHALVTSHGQSAEGISYDFIRSVDWRDLQAFFQAYTTVLRVIEQSHTGSAADTPAETETIQYADHSSMSDFLVLPAIAYTMRWGSKASDDDILDICRWLRNITLVQRPTASGSDSVAAIDLVRRMPRPQLVSILDLHHVSTRLLSDDTRIKLSLLASAQGTAVRSDLLHWLRRAEDHPMLAGCVWRLIEWSTDRRTGVTDLLRLKAYIDTIYNVWGDNPDRRADLDLLRRAMLTVRHPGYPIVRRGETVLSLCWHTYDWQRLMLNSPGVVRHMLDRIVSRNELQSPVSVLQAMIDRFADRSHPWYFLIKNPEIMSLCARRTLMRPCRVFVGMRLSEMPDLYRVGAAKWWIEQLEMKPMPGWSTIRAYGARCLYTDHCRYDAAIDIYYTPDKPSPYRVEFFNRSESAGREPIDLAAATADTGIPLRYDRRRNRRYIECQDARTAIGMARALANLLRN